MRRQTLGWISVACAVPFAFWLMAPADAEWVGTDDRMGEFAAPAGTRVFEAPEWSPAGETCYSWRRLGRASCSSAGACGR
jgi:hypothetical protein